MLAAGGNHHWLKGCVFLTSIELRSVSLDEKDFIKGGERQ
jgi:hypothetical protein